MGRDSAQNKQQQQQQKTKNNKEQQTTNNKRPTMTIDDESSIYIGGLPYDASEDSLRRVFQFYGSVVAVKIINDRATRGKCYGFVTFTNPRSAIDAMEEMNGRTIGGRVIRVNEVRTRGGRSNFDGESFRHDFESGRDWDRGWDRDRDRDRDRDQDRGRDYDHNRERYRDRSSDRLRDRDRTRDYDQERERRHEHVYNHDQARNGLIDRDQDQDRDLGDADLEHSRIRNPSWEREQVLDPDGDREMDRTNGHHDKLVELDRDQKSRKWNGSNNTDQHGIDYISNSNDQHGREYPSNSNNDSDDQTEEQLQESMQRLEELKKEIQQMEESLEEKGKLVLDLQLKSKKLEDALINAKKTSAYRKTQLAKLHRSFQQVQEYNERRKSCEKELQSLVDAAMLEEDINDNALWDGIFASGNA